MRTIYSHLGRLLLKLHLSENESRMVVAAFTCPGLTGLQLGKQCGFKKMTTYRTLEPLISKNYLKELIDPKTKTRVIYPVSLRDIAKRVDSRCADLKRFAGELEEINSLLIYPFKAQEKKINIAKYYGEEAREAWMDLRYRKWNFVYGLGDLDSYANNKENYDIELKWIADRVKKGRAGRGIFTTFGEVTKEISGNDEKQLRESRLKLNLIQGHFFVIIPDLDLTAVIKNTQNDRYWEFLTIESPDLSKFYANFIENQFRS